MNSFENNTWLNVQVHGHVLIDETEERARFDTVDGAITGATVELEMAFAEDAEVFGLLEDFYSREEGIFNIAQDFNDYAREHQIPVLLLVVTIP